MTKTQVTFETAWARYASSQGIPGLVITNGSRSFCFDIVAELGETRRVLTFARLLIEEKPTNLRIKPDPGIDVILDLRLGAFAIIRADITHERDAIGWPR